MQDSMKHSTFKRITAFGTTILAVLALNAAAQDAKPPKSAKSSSPINEDRRIDLRRMQSECDYRAIVKAYADYMIEHGRDRYGQVHSPLFMTVLNRKTGKAFKPGYPHVITKPYAPGLRRDHKMRPYDRTYRGSNPLEDIPLYELLYRYTELTGDKRYAAEADKSIAWFFEHGWSPKTKLPGWGSHMYYDVNSDMAVFAGGNPEGGYGGHEYNYVWPYWDQTPEALRRFACELWNQHIKDKKTGGFNRHSTDGGTGMEFPQTGSCYMDAWAREYGRSGDPEMKAHIETLLKLFHSMRDPNTGAMAWCSAKGSDRREVASVGMNLFMATTLQDAAAHVEKRDPELAEEMREFVRFMDDEYLSNDYDKILDVAGKGILTWYTVADRNCMAKGFTAPPAGVDASVGFPLTAPDGKPAASLYYLTPWFPGRSYAGFSNLLRDRYERCEEKHKATYRRALLDTADIYMSIGPEVQFAQYPDNIADAVALLRYVYKLTDDVAYLHRADQIMQMGVKLFFDDTSPLPKITNFDDWYESSLKNESSVENMRQMLELSLDLEALPESRRTAPRVDTEEQEGMWHAEMTEPAPDMVLRYGPENEHDLYLSFQATQGGRQIRLADVITRIPTAEEADKLNGRMKGFTGKGHTTARIPYGGFKDVPRKIALKLRNTGKQPVDVQVTATLHDTYHDNGETVDEKRLNPGETGLFAVVAPESKWIRRLAVDRGKNGDIRLDGLAFAMSPRSQLELFECPMCGNRGKPDEFIDNLSEWNHGLCQSCGKISVQPTLISDGLVLHLSGDTLGELAADSAVGEWKNQRAPALVATAEGDRRPTVVRKGGHTLLRFDGKDDYLTIPDRDSLDLQAWTLFAVIRHEGGAGVVLTKTDERNHMMNYRLQVGKGGFSAVVRGPSGKHQVNRAATAEILNRYALVTARFDPTAAGVDKIALMIDGVPATQYGYQNAAGSVTDITHDRPLEIGRQPRREPRYFKGEIAIILLYNRALHRLEQTQVARWLQQRIPEGGE